jgi:hypothetical protein
MDHCRETLIGIKAPATWSRVKVCQGGLNLFGTAEGSIVLLAPKTIGLDEKLSYSSLPPSLGMSITLR